MLTSEAVMSIQEQRVINVRVRVPGPCLLAIYLTQISLVY